MRPLSTLLIAGCLSASTVLAQPPARMTDDAMFSFDSSGLQPEALSWSADGRLAYRWREGGDALRVLDPATGKSEVLLPIPDIRYGGEELNLEEYLWSPRGDSLLLLAGGDLYLYPLGDKKLRRLTTSEEDEQDPEFSPDGSRVAFIRGFDLHVVEIATGRETALTRDGEENVFLNGVNDWVYWEEIWDREATGFWWSPDSRRIAYYRFDEREVPVHALNDEAPVEPAVEWQKYPKPGDKLPKVRIGVVETAGGETSWMKTGEEDSYLARVAWTPTGEVAIQRLNREQNRLDLLRCKTADGACSTLLTETSKTWINLGMDFRFLDDGRFLWGSDRTGWRRLSLHAADGALLRPLIPDGWAISSLDGVAGDTVIVTAFRTEGMGPADRQIYRTSVDRELWEPLTTEPGTHEALVAKTGSWVRTWSDADTPQRREVRTASGTAIPLPYLGPSEYDPADLPKYEFLFIPGPEGTRLPARMLKPQGFDPGRRYPAIMYHYGGPGSQVVLNRWGTQRRDLWHKKMAQRGFVVFSVDNRASLSFGKAGEDRDHRSFGPVNLEAQLAGVEYLKSLGWVDPARIGIWGWSGGGYHTLYALLNAPGVWKAGVSGAPVTDWLLYDAIWTERYLGTPANNPEGYKSSSVTHQADRLQDRLLIVHGFADNNVHPQNTIWMTDRLVAAGKPFEQAFYPGQTHTFRGPSQRHWMARMTEFFERELAAVESGTR